MGNRATITAAPFTRENAAIYVHWNGGRASIEAFCKAAKELGYRDPERDPEFSLARLTGLIATFFGLDESTSLGLGTVDGLIDAGDDQGCWVIGADWAIAERRGCDGKVSRAKGRLEYDVDKLSDLIVRKVRAAAAAAAAIKEE